MIFEKQRVMGWLESNDVARLETGESYPRKPYIIHNKKRGWSDERDRVPCYYNPPEHPFTVMSNVYECAKALNNLFDGVTT